jgi:hypothetical protein
MLNEKELNTNTTLNYITNQPARPNLFTPKALQDFENKLTWEIEGFYLTKDQLIADIESFYFEYFHEQTEGIQGKAHRLIFPVANNSASLVVKYLAIEGLDVITVKEIEII